MCIRQRIGGSNPPLTAIFKEELVRKCELFFSHFICLYGSEHGGRVEYVTSEFLSCLYGSERQLSQPLQDCSFLSCLYGSELKYYTFSPLLIKQNHLIFLLSPFFILTFFGQPVTRFLAHFQRNTFLIQLNLQLDDEFIHHLMDHVG